MLSDLDKTLLPSWLYLADQLLWSVAYYGIPRQCNERLELLSQAYGVFFLSERHRLLVRLQIWLQTWPWPKRGREATLLSNARRVIHTILVLLKEVILRTAQSVFELQRTVLELIQYEIASACVLIRLCAVSRRGTRRIQVGASRPAETSMVVSHSLILL